MDCTEVLDQLAEYLDPDERAELCREIEAHLKLCHDCKFKVDTLRKTIEIYQEDSKRVVIPIRAAERLEEVMAREYQQKGGLQAD